MKNDFQERIKTFLIDQDKLAKKLKLTVKPIIYFPYKKRTPIMSRLALWITRKQGAVLDTKFQDAKK